VDIIGDAALGVNGGDLSVVGGQVLEVMETSFRATERLLVARV
jgi:hypothetical protein